jgi:hypothetical protein
VSVNSMNRLAAAVVGCGLALSLTGCGGSSSGPVVKAQVTSSPAPSVTKTASPTAAQTVAKVALATADLNGGFKVKLIPGGDQVKGQVTLDNCGYSFSTEAHRVARRQVDILNAKGQKTGGSNEVVAYDSIAEAKLALAQWRASMKHCHLGVFWRSHVAGTPPVAYLKFTQTSSSKLPVADNDVASGVVEVKGYKERDYGLFVFQRSGNVLDALYLDGPRPSKPADVAAMIAFAQITGNRLAAATGSVTT